MRHPEVKEEKKEERLKEIRKEEEGEQRKETEGKGKWGGRRGKETWEGTRGESRLLKHLGSLKGIRPMTDFCFHQDFKLVLGI